MLLSQCITALTLAGLEFRADKSCSFVNGRSINTTSVSKASDHAEVPSSMLLIYSRPVKFPGHITDGSI